MQRLEGSGEVRPIYGSLGVKRLTVLHVSMNSHKMCMSAFWLQVLHVSLPQ